MEKWSIYHFLPSTYFFHLFWWHYTTIPPSLYDTKYKGDIGVANSGRVCCFSYVRSSGGKFGGDDGIIGGGSGSGTSICNGNHITSGGFLTGATTTGSAITLIDMVRMFSYNISVMTVNSPFPSCAVSFRYSGSGGGDVIWVFFTFL